MTVQTPLVKSEQAAMIGANRNARKAGIMPTLPTSQSQYFDTAVFNAQVPKEGPKAMGVTAAFGNGPGQAAEYDINLYLTQAQQYMTQVSSVFVDNSENGRAFARLFADIRSQERPDQGFERGHGKCELHFR